MELLVRDRIVNYIEELNEREMQDQDSLTQMDRAHLIMEALSLGGK